MSYYLLSNESETVIKGVFNEEDKIPTDNGSLITYNRSRIGTDINDTLLQSIDIDTDNDILYIFFQNINDKISNIKIFDSISKAQYHRENNYSYGYIIGLKINMLYDNILECEYLSLKQIH